MIEKIIKNFVIIVGICIGLFIIFNIVYTIYKQPSTRHEAICEYIDSIQRYNELLNYNNFKENAKDFDIYKTEKENHLIRYKILKEYMLNYNKECKKYSKEEEELINENYNKIISEIISNSMYNTKKNKTKKIK